jgi:hypothetical protein
MFKLAGALLNKPEVLKRAAAMYPQSAVFGTAAKIAKDGGSEILKSSLPGALITTGLGTITTGNPLAGLAIGAADLGLSAGGAMAINRYAPQLAGKYRSYVSPDYLEKNPGATSIPVDQMRRVYEPSIAQNAAMLAGSVASPVVLEPMFLKMQQDQQLSQNVTQAQQLGQQAYINQMYAPYTADGTLYQLQGLPPRA